MGRGSPAIPWFYRDYGFGISILFYSVDYLLYAMLVTLEFNIIPFNIS